MVKFKALILFIPVLKSHEHCTKRQAKSNPGTLIVNSGCLSRFSKECCFSGLVKSAKPTKGGLHDNGVTQLKGAT